MRVFKILCALVCLSCIARFILYFHAIHPPQVGSAGGGQSIFAASSALGGALLFAIELYGLHKRALFAWILGWVILAATFVNFLSVASYSILKTVPKADHPWVAIAATMVMSSLVALYWGVWWSRQKAYFASQSLSSSGTRRKELVAVVCVSALAFAGMMFLSSRAGEYVALATPAVNQFHEEVASERYRAIYDAADVALRNRTTESDFVNLLRSVRESLGNVEVSKLSLTNIAWHGKHSATISLIYYTTFVRGTATERFLWEDRDGRLTLARYQIFSAALPNQ
jgi:hypothetical protein